MKLETRLVGTLQARVLDTGTQPTHLAFLCHGFGAPGSDLVGLGAEWLRMEPSLESVRFVFPEGPLTLAEVPGARAWWQIDMTEVERALAEGRERNMADQKPPGLSSARQKLRGLVDAMMQELGLGWDRVILGGFSQGAMLTTDLSFRVDESPAGLMVLSGTLLNEKEWSAHVSRRPGLPIFQSHGRNDPILPYSQALALKRLFDHAKLPTSLHSFEGGHEIPQGVLRDAALWLKERVAKTKTAQP